MAISERTLTLDEFVELPEKKPALEFENGVVTQKVPPRPKHAALQYAVCELFNRFGRPSRLAIAFPELRATFGEFSRVPDVAVYAWDRIRRDDAGKLTDDYYTEPPDIVVEVISPGETPNRMFGRCLWFVENGVRAVLLIDPYDESILSFRPNGVMVLLRGADAVDLDDILPGFTITVDRVFETLLLT
jgi:Uma2 family endonuclease